MRRFERTAAILLAGWLAAAGTAAAQHVHDAVAAPGHGDDPAAAPRGGEPPAAERHGHEPAGAPQHGRSEPPQDDHAAVPPVTPEERAAAFPDVGGHDPRDMMLERPLNHRVMLDHLERHDTEPDATAVWDLDAWLGRDLARLVARSSGERAGGATEAADLELLWGRSFSRWWSWTAGARRDFGAGPERGWAAVGIEGLAPQWFEIEATAYVGEGARTAARLEAEYEVLITNRLVLEPKVEIDWYGRDDPTRGLGAGLSSSEAGLRLRYEIRREIAPYVGYVWARKHGATADLARAAGEDPSEGRFVAGIRLWF